VAGHMQELPDLTASVKYDIIDDASRDGLTSGWKSWVEEAGRSSDAFFSPQPWH
jgi:hypothetical protein